MIFYILAFVLTCLLQYWLSGRKSRIPGLILPVLNLLLSLVMILSFAAFSFVDASVSTVTQDNRAIVQDESGHILSVSSLPEEVEAMPDDGSAASIGVIGGADGPTAVFVTGGSDVLTLVFVFLLNNIPTAVYLLIYVMKRRQIKRSSVDKTLIQDL